MATIYYYYAKIDNNNVCIDVVRSREQITDPVYIEISIDQYNDTYDEITESPDFIFGKKYDMTTNTWTVVTQPVTKEDLEALKNDIDVMLSRLSVGNVIKSIQRGYNSVDTLSATFEHEVDPTKCVVIINGTKKDGQDGSITFAIHEPYLKEITATGLKVGFQTYCSREEGYYSWQVVEFN